MPTLWLMRIRAGLGLEAQRKAVADFLAGSGALHIAARAALKGLEP